MTETNSKGGAKRPRRTRIEIIEATRAKLARLEAQVDGTFDASQDESFNGKRLRAAIRRNETAIKNAESLLFGRAGTDKSPAIASIDVKIANAEKHVRNLQTAKESALAVQAQAPFNVDKLVSALASFEAGNGDGSLPDGLYVLPGDETDVQKEVAFANREHD